MAEIENPGGDAPGISEEVLEDDSDNNVNGGDAQLPSTAFLEHLARTRPHPDGADPTEPMIPAGMYIAECFMMECPTMPGRAVSTLVRDAGEFYAWDGTRYVLIPEENIKAGLYLFLQEATY
jgi:hypothetical protein